MPTDEAVQTKATKMERTDKTNKHVRTDERFEATERVYSGAMPTIQTRAIHSLFALPCMSALSSIHSHRLVCATEVAACVSSIEMTSKYGRFIAHIYLHACASDVNLYHRMIIMLAFFICSKRNNSWLDVFEELIPKIYIFYLSFWFYNFWVRTGNKIHEKERTIGVIYIWSPIF